MKAQEKALNEGYQWDYTTYLPVFVYPDEKKSQSMYPDMDIVIEKCSEVIERHSIYLKKKEHIKWIDDSYILIGESRFYKQEYGLAEETFLYVYQAYKKDPNRYRGLNWLIKTYIETEQWSKAEDFLDLGEEEFKKYPEELKGEYYAAYADFHFKRDNDLIKAALSLEDAIKFEKDKDLKRRYTFILAQIYQEQRNFKRATELYAQVIKLRPDYQMRFNAKINRAIAYDVTSNDPEEIKKELRKMLKDKKNEEYQDQIYYALAELALKEDDEPLAVSLLRKSVNTSVNNNMQKALSYYKLADLYFERPDYVKAQEHYDSTIQFLPDDHPDYYIAEEKNNNLQDLVKNLKVIILQDSLLALGNLDEKDRKKAIQKIIKAKKEEDERKELARLRELEKQQAQQIQNNAFNNTGSGKGQWYFYNPTTLSIGMSDFKQTWGDIQLKDHWNRSSAQLFANNQSEVNDDQAQIDPEQARKDSIAKAEKYNPEHYLKDVPVEFKDKLKAHGKIVQALFNVGTLFKESFDDNSSSIKSFKRVTNEYDTSRYNLAAHYQLYRIYLEESEKELAEEEKKWILENHPFSEYAYLIKNPNYNKESKETKQKVEEFYQATYKLFKYQMYADVVSSCNRAEAAFTKNHLRPQFAFMKAKAMGHINDKETFKKELEFVVSEFPDDPVKEKAQEILNYMNKNKSEKKPNSNAISRYKNNPSEPHMVIVSIEGKNANGVKNEVSNFNNTSFREAKLQITNSALKQKQMMLVRSFKNDADALKYHKAMNANPTLMKIINENQGMTYIISNSNFRILFKDKNEEAYFNYFLETYPPNK